MSEHIADHPAYPILSRVVTAGRMHMGDVHDLERQGYDVLGSLTHLHSGATRQSLTADASAGRLTEHDLFSGLIIDRNLEAGGP